MAGYITVPRDIIESPVFQDPKMWQRFCWLLFRARFKAGDVLVDTKVYHLEAGQQVASYRFLADSWAMDDGLQHKDKPSTTSVSNTLKFLENCGVIKRQSSPGGVTVITICHYERYQSYSGSRSNTRMDSSMDSRQYTSSDSNEDTPSHKQEECIEENKREINRKIYSYSSFKNSTKSYDLSKRNNTHGAGNEIPRSEDDYES